uniref:Uncharacterized protein n=1 Tax=Rhizophora mucronata TaxID=61149 RepID=A0A2P2PIW5_RHIMU
MVFSYNLPPPFAHKLMYAKITISEIDVHRRPKKYKRPKE